MPESDLKTTVSPGWQPDAEGEVGLAAGSVRRAFQLWEWGSQACHHDPGTTPSRQRLGVALARSRLGRPRPGEAQRLAAVTQPLPARHLATTDRHDGVARRGVGQLAGLAPSHL